MQVSWLRFCELPIPLVSLGMEHGSLHYLQRLAYSKTSTQTSSTQQGKACSKESKLHSETVCLLRLAEFIRPGIQKAGGVAQCLSTCLAHIKPWVQVPSFKKWGATVQEVVGGKMEIHSWWASLILGERHSPEHQGLPVRECSREKFKKAQYLRIEPGQEWWHIAKIPAVRKQR